MFCHVVRFSRRPGWALARACSPVSPRQRKLRPTPKSGAPNTGQKKANPLYIFRKRLGAPKPGESSRPVLFLVHGSSVTWRIFDLDTPGHGEYSMMNVFARWGFDVWTMDHENYGKSGRTGGNSDIASGAQDLKAAMQVVMRETGQSRAHFMGESSGALRAAV